MAFFSGDFFKVTLVGIAFFLIIIESSASTSTNNYSDTSKKNEAHYKLVDININNTKTTGNIKKKLVKEYIWKLNTGLVDASASAPNNISLKLEKLDESKRDANKVKKDGSLRKRTHIHKRRRISNKKNPIRIHARSPIFNSSTPNNSTINPLKRKRKRKNRRRKLRRNKNKQKQKLHNNILEVTTTAKGIVLPTNSDSNSTLDALIKKLNENPEDNFEEFRRKNSNHSSNEINPNPNPNKVENLVAPINKTTTTNNTTNEKPPKRFNRCKKNNGGCNHFCNPKGDFKCSCMHGFKLSQNQRTCLDINECEINNGGCSTKCLNLLGSFECQCSDGFRLSDDGKTCEDINECLLRNGHGPCQDACSNSIGSYTCTCANLNGTKLATDGRTCSDLDECLESNGGCSHGCINAVNRAFCVCPEGMELSSDRKTCQDLDECEDPSVRTLCRNGCLNTEGSYRCLDRLDFQNDEAVARKTACKPLFPPPTGYITCSRDGTFPSFSKKGRKRVKNGPGTVCELECPIGFRASGQFHATCGMDGDWQGITDAICVEGTPPTLDCPPDRKATIEEGYGKVLVEFPEPKCNVGWKHVRAHPKWAKNLRKSLKVGNYDVTFTVKDPSTRLSASCSFKIVISL